MKTRSQLDRRAAGLSSAEALRLEEHLSGCETCSEHAELLSGLREIASHGSAALSPAEREQAFASAWRRAGQLQPLHRGPRVGNAWVALALAAAVVAGLVLRSTWSPATPSLPVAQRGTAASAEVPDGAVLASPDVTTVQLAHARVVLRAHSSARWNAGARELALQSGSVLVDVDPSKHQSFSVTTASFAVQVLGTLFEVTETSVSVQRGRVRVVALDGHELRVLNAGERYAAGEPEPVLQPEPQPAVVPEVQPEAVPRPQPSAASHAARTAQPVRAHEDISARIEQARAELAQRHVAAAQSILNEALAREIMPSARAEALTLRAECALMSGDAPAAIGAYL
ncbi:MAG TPA: FecR domain-containing protein, partial [Polyangiales bacterium]|nr:FecR domain-containing protein [Polyangiales bacterium]